VAWMTGGCIISRADWSAQNKDLRDSLYQIN
jgi:hypothetical protein